MAGISVASGLAGGLGLFLLGLWLATDGLKVAGGGVLAANLASWTRDRRRAFEMGFAMSLLVPSWGGLTRAAIGLVNTGRIALRHAVWVVVGCGFGTVTTAWIVVAVGFSPRLWPVALTLLGVGVLLRGSGTDTRFGSGGQVLAGAAVLLLGVHILAGAAEALEGGSALLITDPFLRTLGGALAGAVVAIVLASAGAAVSLIVVGTAAGAVDPTTAAALLVGANLGAAAGALSAFRDGTPDARRVAVGQMAFHGAGSAFGLLLVLGALPVLGVPADPRGGALLLLAGFQTLFCAMGAFLVRIAEAPLLLFLESRFAGGEAPARSRRLDPNLIGVPELALEGLVAEVGEIAGVTHGLAHAVLVGDVVSDFRLARDLEAVDVLARAVDETLGRLFRAPLSPGVADSLLDVARAAQAHREIARHLSRLRGDSGAPEEVDPRLKARFRQAQLALLHHVQGCDPRRPRFSLANARGELDAVEGQLRGVRQRLLADGMGTGAPAAALASALEGLDRVGRIGELAVSAAESLVHVADAAGGVGEDQAMPALPPAAVAPAGV
ncbi:MAG: hypothetical protein AB1726_03770 [Planctomycetota bacterium]